METISLPGNITLLGSFTDREEIISLMKSFDWYTSAIDSYSDMKRAEARNNNILLKIKELGVVEVLNPEWNFFGTKERNFKL